MSTDSSMKIELEWCVVSEPDPDPRKIEREGLVNWAGWKCTLRNVINC